MDALIHLLDLHTFQPHDFIIVAVPTPVDAAHIPDFRPLVGASTSVGRHMKRGTTVVYESTVYPGATEEVCIPVLEPSASVTAEHSNTNQRAPSRVRIRASVRWRA